MTAEHGREKSILAIVEGRKREPALMKAMLDKFGISERYRIVSFETVVYQLFSYLDACGGPEEAELVDVLRDLNAGDEEKLRLLEGPFTDVVLVFDFDPQDDRYDEGALRRYAEAFCDSTDSGLLFINYPSVESYRDFEALGDASFVDERVAFVGGGVGGRGYKEYVAERRNGLDDIAHIDALQWARIIAMHVSKAQHLLEGKGAEDCAYWAPSAIWLRRQRASTFACCWIMRLRLWGREAFIPCVRASCSSAVGPGALTGCGRRRPGGSSSRSHRLGRRGCEPYWRGASALLVS